MLAFNKARETFAMAGSDGFWVTLNMSSSKSGMPIKAASFSKEAKNFVHAFKKRAILQLPDLSMADITHRT
jgi:hypothetical protein